MICNGHDALGKSILIFSGYDKEWFWKASATVAINFFSMRMRWDEQKCVERQRFEPYEREGCKYFRDKIGDRVMMDTYDHIEWSGSGYPQECWLT